jgi:hypothetical protein
MQEIIEMRVALVYLLKGEPRELQQKLVKEVGPMFGENYMIENPLPAHVTLKAPFQMRNIKKLEKFIEKFVRKNSKRNIKISGFGNFHKKVAFIKTKFSREGRKVHKTFVKELQKSLKIKPDKFDLKWKPHSTIAYGNTKESFKKIWNYVKNLKKPRFDLKFDNITILIKPRKYWKIHKEFKLK